MHEGMPAMDDGDDGGGDAVEMPEAPLDDRWRRGTRVE